MKTLLITAFEPFGGESENPSALALELLPDGSAILADMTKYDRETGLALNAETGIGLFI